MDDENCIHDAGVILRADPGRPRSYKMHMLHQLDIVRHLILP